MLKTFIENAVKAEVRKAFADLLGEEEPQTKKKRKYTWKKKSTKKKGPGRWPTKA